MLSLDLPSPDTARGALAPFRSDSHDAVLAELSPVLFGSLSRSDQYRKGVQYVRGLLEARGRKSVRNIAALLGEQVSEQNLHHFISDSTWDWIPVRRALAAYMAAVATPQAWVVQSMIIPKTGQHSVGVDKLFFPALGQVLNAQRAVGVWAASEEMSVPVNWRLLLPQTWLNDEFRRRQVAIPDGVGVETVSESVVGACLEVMSGWRLPVRPMVLNTYEAQAASIFQALRSSGIPLLVKVAGSLRLSVADPAFPAGTGKSLPASRIMDLAKDRRRPVVARAPWPETTRPRRLAAVVRVGLPAPAAGADPQEPLHLLGVGGEGGTWPGGLWLTNLTTAPPAYLVRLSALAGKVEQDFSGIADRVGIRDYTGRSFSGWHRHITLASAAHAVAALADGPQ